MTGTAPKTPVEETDFMFGFAKLAKTQHSTKYRPDIDGLRAVAVSSVVVSHALPQLLPGGFVGVDVFFVISGYLISTILIADIENNRFSLLRFYDRRVRRIFPALVTVLLATLAGGWFVLFRPEFSTLGGHVAASALFSENFLLWSESGYFDTASKSKPLLHLWSLAIEEQFYIFWPLILFVSIKKRINLVVLLTILSGLSFAVNLYDIRADPTAAYYSPLGRFWELMIGSFLAYLQIHKPGLLKRHNNLQSIAGALLLVAALLLTSPARNFPGFWALLPTVGTFLLISAGEAGWVNRTILSARPMIWCGLISYPLYLWHWPILSYSHIVFGEISTTASLGLIGLAVVASIFTFLIIERPFRASSKGAAKPLMLAGAMLAVLACGALVYAYGTPRLFRFNAPTRAGWDFLKSRTPDFDKNANGFYPIHADRPNLALFIGDSHLAQYAERIDKVLSADPGKMGAVLAIGGGCIPIENSFTPDVSRRGCWPLRDQAYRMAQEPRFGTVVIGGAWNSHFRLKGYSYVRNGQSLPLDSIEGRTAALAQLERRIAQLVRSGKRVVLVLDNPRSSDFVATGPAVRLGPSAAGFVPNREVRIKPDQSILQQQFAAMARRAGASVINPFAAVCRNDNCRAISETGMPIFQDAGHFNPEWAVDNATFIDAAVQPPTIDPR